MKIWISEPTLGLPVPDMTTWGKQMPVKKSSPLHFDALGATLQNGEAGTQVSSEKGMTFGDMLIQGLHAANEAQLEAGFLAEKVTSDPTSVDAHEVTVAMAKANMSLSIAKAVIDRTVTSFKEILNQR